MMATQNAPIESGLWLTAGFLLFIAVMLTLDLGVFNRKAHSPRPREAFAWTCVWVGLAFGFGFLLYWWYGAPSATEYFTGYIIEWSLSVDNLFVFIMIFKYFSVDPQNKHRVLFWGILTAMILRGIMILGGVALIRQFHWVIYIFGVFLIYTGGHIVWHKKDDLDPEHTLVVRLARRFLPVTREYHGSRFIVKDGARWLVTPLMLVLLAVEATDVVFALDSIPAIFAITQDPFIIFTSNIFAILGLRSLFFLIAGMMDRFRYLKFGLAFVLGFVGVKMLVSGTSWAVPTPIALGVIVAVLAGSVALPYWLGSNTNH